MRLLCLLILLVVSVSSQDIQIHEVRDFSGGLVNSVANALMQDNQLTVMVNYDVGTDGLERRNGLELHNSDTITDIIDGLLVYHGPGQKQLLVVRSYDDFSNLDSAIRAGTSRLAKCTESPAACTSVIIDTLFNSFRDTLNANVPVMAVILNENLVFGGYGRELYLYDGETAFPARPLGPGQTKAVAINGGGALTGMFSYKTAFREWDTENYSLLSASSWPVEVHEGKVMLRLYPPSRVITDDTAHQWILILREESGVDTAFRVIDSLSAWEGSPLADTLIYIDEITSPGSYVPHEWGFDDSALMTTWWRPDFGRECSGESYNYTSPQGPGAPIVTPIATTGPFYLFPDDDSLVDPIVAYFVTYVDSAGRESLPSALAIVRYDEDTGQAFLGDNFSGHQLDSLPVPTDPKITKKRIYRYSYAHFWPDTITTDTFMYWYFLVELDPEINSFTDNRNWGGFASAKPEVYCLVMDTINLPHAAVVCSSRYYPYSQDDFCSGDSLLTFKPTAIENHTSRIYAIGNPDQPNRLSYSDFGRPSTFPPPWFLYVQPMEGDWFSGLLSLANDQLLIPRQNSIVLLQGASYYQYSVDRIVNNIGLQAPNTLSRLGTQTFFAHNNGLYELGAAANNQSPYSQVIDNSLDSIRSALTFSVGRIVDNEYWWSLPFGASDHINTKTYILSFVPKPHWKCYDFGIQDAVPFGFDTTVSRIGQTRWVLLTNPNTLYRWGYNEDLNVDPGGGYSGRLKTKAFLEGPGRKKILWVEVLGSGIAQDWTLTFWDKLGVDSVGAVTYTKNLDSTVDARITVNKIVEDFTLSIDDNGDSYSDTVSMFGNKDTVGTYELLASTIQFGHWDASYMSTWGSNNVPECTVNTIYCRVGAGSVDTGIFGYDANGTDHHGRQDYYIQLNVLDTVTMGAGAATLGSGHLYTRLYSGPGTVEYRMYVYEIGATDAESPLVASSDIVQSSSEAYQWLEIPFSSTTLESGKTYAVAYSQRSVDGTTIPYFRFDGGVDNVRVLDNGSFNAPANLTPFPSTASGARYSAYAEWTEISTAKVRLAVYDCDDVDPDNWTVEDESQYIQLPDNYPLGWASIQCTLALTAGRKALSIIAYDGVPTDSIQIAYSAKSSGPAIITTPSAGVFRDPLAFNSTPGLDSTRSWCIYAEFTRADTTLPDYKIHGIRFAWIPWDEGKKK